MLTNEEIERAIDFLLKSQANSEARIEQTNEQLNRLAGKVVELTVRFDQMSFQLGSYADTQVEFMRTMTMFMESEARFRKSTEAMQVGLEEAITRSNKSLAVSHARAEKSQARINESLRASIGELAARQSKTEEALVRLADAQVQSERRMDTLTRIVEEERGR